MIERHFEHQGNWQEFLRQIIKDWRTYPQLTNDQLNSIICPNLFIAENMMRWHQRENLNGYSRYLIVPSGSPEPHMVRENPTFVNDTILQFLEQNQTTDRA